jgi:hypothetical protein
MRSDGVKTLACIRKRSMEDNNGCWIWSLYIDRGGYGDCRFRGKSRRAHKLALYIVGDITEEQLNDRSVVVRHLCDNPPCVNPSHLRAGTHADNVRDKMKKGRYPVGNAHWNSVINDEESSHIAQLLKQGIPQRKIAKLFNVTKPVIERVSRETNLTTQRR